MSKFGDMVRKAREDMDISQRTLSFMTGISNAEISRIESGKRRNPSIDTITKITGFLKGIKTSEAIKAVFEDSILLGTDDERKIEEDVWFEDDSDSDGTHKEFDSRDVLGIYSTAYLFGVTPDKVCEWIDDGDLAVTMDEDCNGDKEFCITDDNIIDFAKRHKDEGYYKHIVEAGLVEGDDSEENSDYKYEFSIYSSATTGPIKIKGNSYYHHSGLWLSIYEDIDQKDLCGLFRLDNVVGFSIERR